MLKDEKIKKAFNEIAESYRKAYSDAWFIQEASLRHEGNTSLFTEDCLQKIHDEFPVVFVDHGWKNPRRMAAHPRRPWNGTFASSNQCILINGTVSGHRETFHGEGTLAN